MLHAAGKEVITMPVYKITFQVEAEDVPAALTKLKNEPDVLKYVVSVYPIKEQQGQSGWGNTLKSQLFGSKK
jgi:hypothetical protein